MNSSALKSAISKLVKESDNGVLATDIIDSRGGMPIVGYNSQAKASALFNRIFEQKDKIEFLLLGTGDTQLFPSLAIRREFERNMIGLEFMDTGAACRTYNICMDEKRAVAAALIAVDVISAKKGS